MTSQSDVIGDPRFLPVLDHGFIGIVSFMGDDASVVQAARVSYGAGTKTLSEDRGLIRYLMRMQHSTPFEMNETKFHVRAPIFVARQWMRHRSASINEESARYSKMSNEFYLPDVQHIQPQAKNNKQGRSGALSEMNAEGARWFMEAAFDHAHQSYDVLLGDRVGRDASHPGFDLLYDPYASNWPLFDDDFAGIARESARAVMPVASYTEWFWKLNLHNLFHFLQLRADPHAQYEIRVYAEAIIELIRPLYPICVEAFEDYVQGAVSLSKMEAALIAELAQSCWSFKVAFLALANGHGSLSELAKARGMTARELKEFMTRFDLASDN